MPRRSIWKGSFVDAFLLRMKKKRYPLFNRKIWSRTSSISPEFVDCSVRIYYGKTPVHYKINELKVGHKFGELLVHGNEDLREKILDQEEKRGKSKV